MSTAPRTAIRGCSRSANDRMATGLGYFSLALGAAELAAAGVIGRAVGLNGYHGLIRAYGAREVATGLAILGSHDATPWIWGRVAGDVVDIVTLMAGAKKLTRAKTLVAVAMLGGAAALDLLCARGLATEKGGLRTARADYSARSGYPKGLQAVRGGASDFAPPRDMRTPEALRSWAVQREPGGPQQQQRHPASATLSAPRRPPDD